jgi:glycogen operon protein
MHVDGFRFDLAASLAREKVGFEDSSSFLDAIRQDPVLARSKLIAEPWDLGGDGYRLGGFPPGWSEWNGRYRDTVRRFWTGEGGLIGDLASRLTGSSDLFGWGGRRPWASINFITAHDGFTLRDLVTYNHKHNEANAENNQDGTEANYSWNCGVEGPSRDSAIKALRLRQMRNLLTTLLLSQGVPMLLAGDELGRTQRGNNNAYCQDNEISWIDWASADEELLAFVRQLIAIRNEHPVFRRPRFFSGHRVSGTTVKDITWITPEGREMAHQDWIAPYARALGFLLGGEVGAGAGELADDTFLVLMNAYVEPISYALPENTRGRSWTVIIDTSTPSGLGGGRKCENCEDYVVAPRSVSVLTRKGALSSRDRQEDDEA